MAISPGDFTSFHIHSFSPNPEDLTYERDAAVPFGSSFLRLISTDARGQPRYLSVGRVLYSTAVKLWESEVRQASFETTIKFQISSSGNAVPIEGMTFFIVPQHSTESSGGEGSDLGIFNAVAPGKPIFAVVFDVNKNNDPKFPHIGININSKIPETVTEFEGGIGKFVMANIRYHAPSSNISVVATYGLKQAQVGYTYNLKTLLPKQVQVGISASTGQTGAAFFDVHSWDFISSM